MPRPRRLEPEEIAVGTDWTNNIALYDDDGSATAVAGASATWRLYRGVARRVRRPHTGTPVLEKTSAAGQITLSAGNAAVVIADTDLSLESGDFWQELLFTDSAGAVTVKGQGRVHLRAKGST